MYTLQDQKDNHSPRFKFMDHVEAYNLFDAFVKAIILDDKVIDFSVPVKENEDGTFEFATLDLSFASISKDHLKIAYFKPGAESSQQSLSDEENILYAHVEWLVSHIAEFAKTLGMKASLRSNKNRDLICVIFNQIATLRNKPEMGSADDAKKLLERFAFRTLIRCDAPIRNGVLHFCNPDEHAFVLAFKEKVRIAKTHEAELAGSGIPTRNFAAAAYEGYGRNYKDFHVDYDADRTEAMLQVIYDKLSERFPTMPQQEFFKKRF